MRRSRILAALVLAALAASLPAAESISLDGSVFYVRKGFDPATIDARSFTTTEDWVVVPPGKGRSLAIRDIDLPGIDRPGLLDLGRGSPESFTIACTLDADIRTYEVSGLALRIPQIGEGWAVYLNGNLIRSELYTGARGSLGARRVLRDVVISLDKRYIVMGRNIIAFHVYGDPGDSRTGISGHRSILLGSYSLLAGRTTEALDIALIGIYVLFAIYHFVLFASRPRHSAYLYYGLGALLFGNYLFVRSATAASVILDTGILDMVAYACLFLVPPILLAFGEKALGRKVSPVAMAGTAFSVVLAACLPFVRLEPLRIAWALSFAVEVAYLLAGVCLPLILRMAKDGTAERKPGDIRLLDVCILAAGYLVIVVAAAFDLSLALGGDSLAYSKYAFLVFVFAASGLLALQFGRAYTDLDGLRVSLERKVLERNAQLEDAVGRQKRIGAEIEHQSRRLADAKEMAERDYAIAERVQRGIFPAEPPLVPGWDLALAYRPAAKVSGDFFDFYLSDGMLSGLAIGDVSGHGMGAGLIAVLARSLFARRWAELGKLPLGEALARLHAEFLEELGGVEAYLTCIFLRLDEGRIEYANAAHPDLLLRRAGAESALALLPREGDDFRGPPLGAGAAAMEAGGAHAGWAALRFSPAAGDVLLLYTDCLIEAKNEAGERYGSERLTESLTRAPASSAKAILEAVQADLEAFTGAGKLDDDLTILVLVKEA